MQVALGCMGCTVSHITWPVAVVQPGLISNAIKVKIGDI